MKIWAKTKISIRVDEEFVGKSQTNIHCLQVPKVWHNETFQPYTQSINQSINALGKASCV